MYRYHTDQTHHPSGLPHSSSWSEPLPKGKDNFDLQHHWLVLPGSVSLSANEEIGLAVSRPSSASSDNMLTLNSFVLKFSWPRNLWAGAALARNIGSCLPLMFINQLLFLFFLLFYPFSAAPAAYGGSQARSGTGAVAASLRYSHSSIGSKPHLWPTPQLTAMLDP